MNPIDSHMKYPKTVRRLKQQAPGLGNSRRNSMPQAFPKAAELNMPWAHVQHWSFLTQLWGVVNIWGLILRPLASTEGIQGSRKPKSILDKGKFHWTEPNPPLQPCPRRSERDLWGKDNRGLAESSRSDHLCGHRPSSSPGSRATSPLTPDPTAYPPIADYGQPCARVDP